MTRRLRNWCFTWNNYPTDVDFTSESVVRAIFGKIKYIVIGFEVGANGTPHLQGYVDFENARTLGGLKKINNAIHWEGRNGTWDEATKYCKKDGNFVEFGTPNEQGRRSDLEAVKNEIEDGLRVDRIVLEDPVMYHQYGRTLNKIEELCMRKKFRTKMTVGFWYWGSTGVGKSHAAFTGYTPETHYVVPNDNGWWDGYTQQDIVIFNDFRGELPYNELLQLIDKWPHWVKRRGREPMPFVSSKVVITSSMPPNEVYCKRAAKDGLGQLLRRIHVFHFDDAQHISGGGGNTMPPHLDEISEAAENSEAEENPSE